jgi:hypothetical protein
VYLRAATNRGRGSTGSESSGKRCVFSN